MMQIRKATIEDIGQLAILFNNYRVFYDNHPDIRAAKHFLAERIAYNDAEVFICINDHGIMVGFTQLYPLFSSTLMKKLWLLNDLFVDEKYRGLGYSVALINRAKDLCVETNACRLVLETAKDNTIGNALYPKVGFHLDTTHNYYSWNA